MGQNEITKLLCKENQRERMVKNDQIGSTVTEETEGRRHASLAPQGNCDPPLG